jgi:hypothetical protein
MKQCETLEKMLKMSSGDRDRAGRVVARSFYVTMRRNGFTQTDIMNVAGHLLDGVIKDMKVKGKDQKEPEKVQSLKVQDGSQEVA